MTATLKPPHRPGSASGPADAMRGPRERQFRAWHAIFAVGLVIAGALGTAALVSRASAEGSYLALAREVDYAAQLSGADLVPVRVDAPPELDPVAASDLPTVVGSYAATRLPAGTLLTRRMLTTDPIPGPGEHVVGLTVRADRLPAQQPQPGDRVLLVSTATDQPDAVGRMWAATVTAVAAPDGGLLQRGGSELTTLDVVVGVAEGPAVARAAAADQLVVIKTAGG